MKPVVCKCGQTAKFIQMLTFSYHYCPVCKDEVKEEDKPSASRGLFDWDMAALAVDAGQSSIAAFVAGSALPFTVPQPQLKAQRPGALPNGYVALRGEQVVCDTCGHLKFFLDRDLPERGPLNFRQWTPEEIKEVNKYVANPASLDCVCKTCCGGEFAGRVSGEFFIRGRGWV